ncbi:MAG: hypothetical protein AB1405_14730, partial [Bdellovibrionota bacterium]
MTIWAVIGFFLFTWTGAYFYYRALAEVKGRKSKEDELAFRDDELLAELSPFATVAFGRQLPVQSGEDLLASAAADGHFEPERLALPLAGSRALPPETRKALHTHQIFSLAEAWRGGRLSRLGEVRWPEAVEIESRLCGEWPGYGARLKRLKSLDVPLYPRLFVKELPVAVAVPDGAGNPALPEAKSRENSSVRAQSRVKRTEKDRGISIERVESEPDSSRPWKGEQRDERSASPEDVPPESGMDLVRSQTPVLRVVRPQGRPEEHLTAADGGLRYDEWDCTQARYRRQYCRVQTRTPLFDATAPSPLREELAGRRQQVREVVRLFDSLRPVPRRARRQMDGDSVDLDAYVDQAVQMRLGGAMNENLYEKMEKSERSVAATLLLDLSASTERWVGRRRAFEVGIESAALFALGQQVLGDEVEILGFSGSGPERVWISNFKRFDERLDEAVLGRLDQARPQAFTRLGAALRHASASLAKRPARHRLLLLLSDARPQDEDGYEGQYAWADTRKALDEARRLGVRP